MKGKSEESKFSDQLSSDYLRGTCWSSGDEIFTNFSFISIKMNPKIAKSKAWHWVENNAKCGKLALAVTGIMQMLQKAKEVKLTSNQVSR